VLLDFNPRGSADHDGAPRPLRSIVLLLPPGRPSSENHLLRLIDKHISFEFVRERLKDSYSDTSRPSIDPKLLLRILLIGYLYGITSERKLVEELGMHLAWRWFTSFQTAHRLRLEWRADAQLSRRLFMEARWTDEADHKNPGLTKMPSPLANPI